MSLLQNSNAISSGLYTIQKSLRFRASASAYLNRTMSASGTTDTWSMWVKRGKLGALQYIYGWTDGVSKSLNLCFNADDTFTANFYVSASYYITTTQVFRDPSAWYHIVITLDTTNATAANRIRMYVNGVQVTALTSSYPAQNYVGPQATSGQYAIGARGNTNDFFLDGYLAEFNLIDGQALTPSSFGQTDVLTGVWTAKKYTGTYGTNGFYLPFTDTSSTTNLVKDSSGNNNNWTPNNISLTAGVTYDSMIDSPTITASGTQPVGNYCVMNPLTNANANTRLSNGNLTHTSASTGVEVDVSMNFPTTGKWYAEYTNTVGSTISLKIANDAGKYIGYLNSGSKETSAAGLSAYGSSWTTNDVIGIAVDCDASTVTFYKNNVSQGALNFSIDSISSTNVFFRNYTANSSATVNANFGQRPFAYTPPTGFKALCTTNLD